MKRQLDISILIVWLALLKVTHTVTEPKDESTAAVVSFTNSLVPPLFQVFTSNHSASTNLVFAPFGLAMSIAITMDCVDGEGFDEITKVFKLQSKSDQQQLRSGFKNVLNDFREASVNDELAGAYNKAFLTSTKVFPVPFVEQLSKNYFVDIVANSSVSKAFTSAQILELRTDTGIMSHWRDYQKLVVYTYLSYSSSAPFYATLGKILTIPMIPFIGLFKAGYVPNLDCHGAELLFENQKASLLLLMPNQMNGLASLRDKLFGENFFEVLDSLPQQETKIMIPQLSAITNNLELIPFLRLLGIVSVFTPSQSNQTTTNRMFVQSIKQNAFFSTSFTALNSVGTLAMKFDAKIPLGKNLENRVRREAITTITFDRPFLFFVIHRDSGLILITGQIVHPYLVPNQ